MVHCNCSQRHSLAFTCRIAGKALVECSTTVAAANNTSAADLGYADVAAAAFGPVGKAFVSNTVYAELFGVCRYADIFHVDIPLLDLSVHHTTPLVFLLK